MLDRELEFRVSRSLALLSQNEALRMRISSSGAGAPARALSGAGTGAGLIEAEEEANLALPDLGAGLAVPDDGPRWAGTQDLGTQDRTVAFDVTPAASRGGFKAARRHSARVRVLRRAAIAGSLIAIALISAAVLLNPLRRLPGAISTGRVGVEGTKITVDSPKISGVQKDGRPFDIKARSGIQDIEEPNIIELLGIDSKIGTAGASTTWVSATRGLYDSSHDKMTLEGDIRIKNSSGYDIRLNTARIDFKTGGLASEGPVNVILDGGTIAAKQLDVSDNGHKVSFGGEVTSMIDTGAREPEAAGALTESIR
jgi:lipopolysaccharide export system protein LptC